MGFFDDFRLPSFDRDEESEPAAPDWFGPPDDWLGGVIPVELLLGRGEDAAAYLTRLVAYPTGFGFTIEVLSRKASELWLEPFEFRAAHTAAAGGELPPELIRYGIQYPDGRRATAFGDFIDGTSTRLAALDPNGPSPDPDMELILTTQGGSGGRRHSSQECWVWPLPPESGVVSFVCEWPRFSIPESAAELESSRIHEAARRARQVWPDDAR